MGYFESMEPWYCYDGDDDDQAGKLANRVIQTVKDIEQRQTSIREGNRRHARIYSGYLPIGMAWGNASISVRQPFPATKGVVRSVCDTATSLIIRSRPRAAFVTDGADWKVQTQAEDLEQFIYGAYYSSDIYATAARCFMDSTIFGTGIWKYVTKGKGVNFKVIAERVLPDDFIVDEEECRSNMAPANTYHRMIVKADALIAKVAKGNDDLASRIRGACGQTWPGYSVPKDCLVIVEAIHVNTDDGAENRQVICGHGFTLTNKKWPYDFHPYTWLHWQLPISGFYGDGVAYRQYGRQERINYLYRWIQRCQDLFSTPRAWVDPAGGPPTSQMSNEIGQVIMARKPPAFQTQEAVNGEIYRWLDSLERGALEDEGISQATAHNELPPGVDSAPAQREYSFKEGQRFASVSQRWEQALAVDAARKMVAMYARYARSSKEPPRTKWADRKMMYTINWPDLDTDAYEIRPQAASFDSMSVAARLQSALELAQTQWLLPGEGRALIAHPDLQRADELGNAGETYATWVLQRLYHGETVPVDEKADLVALDRIIRQGRLLAKTRNAGDAIIDNLSRYLDELDIVQQEAQAAMQQITAPNGNMAPPTNQASVPFAPGE